MKPLLTITGYPPSIGGAQIHTHMLAQHLLRAGHPPRVITHWDEDRRDWLLGTTLRAPETPRDYVLDGVPVHRIGIIPAEKRALAPFAVTYLPFQGPAINRIARVLLPKLAAHADGVSLVHNVRMGREGLSEASLRLARERRIPFVFSPLHHPRWGGWLHRHYHRIYREADALIALTGVERDALVGLGAHPDRVHVTGIGPVLAEEADPTGFRQQHSLGDAPVVLFLGQHYAYKGVEAVLEAAAEVWAARPEVRFVFIGPQTRFSERVMVRYTDKRFLVLGAVDLQTKTNALAACSLLCVPSEQESFGGVYVEAWMHRKPVIAGDIPALHEVVTDGVDGYLAAQQPAVIAERITMLLNDPQRAQALGEAGYQKAAARYTWEQITKRTLEIYRTVHA